jgi:hypothetical protein
MRAEPGMSRTRGSATPRLNQGKNSTRRRAGCGCPLRKPGRPKGRIEQERRRTVILRRRRRWMHRDSVLRRAPAHLPAVPFQAGEPVSTWQNPRSPAALAQRGPARRQSCHCREAQDGPCLPRAAACASNLHDAVTPKLPPASRGGLARPARSRLPGDALQQRHQEHSHDGSSCDRREDPGQLRGMIAVVVGMHDGHAAPNARSRPRLRITPDRLRRRPRASP